MEPEKRHSVRFPESLLKQIKQAAQEDHRSVNGEIVWLVQRALQARREQRRSAQKE
jgi:hypothetical protein